jgi:alpha-beta hydrolase superfamily lysophospholipase
LTYLYWLAFAVILVVLAHVVIGWHLANGLREGILEVYPRPVESPVRVRAVSDGLIVLEASEPHQDVGHPGVLGIAWDGGYGKLGQVVEAHDGQITRRFETMEGQPPLCTGPLVDCPPVILDSFTYPEGPGDVGLEFQTVTYPSELGSMGAWRVPASSDRRWAIMCHGWTTERRELVRMLPAFHRRGWSTLVIDYRNDPGMPADPTGHYRFGVSEWRDVESAVRYVKSRGAEEIVLMGCSTGGALIMAFLEHSKHTKSISGVVLDSPNLVLADTVRLGTADIKATRLMLEMGMWIADLRWKIDWEATNYVQRAAQYLHVPTLVFHGTSDQTVPIAESRQLEARVPSLVELVETPAAGHVRSWNADPERYERYLDGFLETI